MHESLQGLLESWDGEGVVVRHDHQSGVWMFIALHSSHCGHPTGGTRMKVYPTPADGLTDAMRLAEGMTHKWAALGLAYGGGKAVLALSRPLPAQESEQLVERYGRVLRMLSGTFTTGADLGTGPREMEIIARICPHVLGMDLEGRSIDPGPYTAQGVLSGIRAAVAACFGNGELAGRRVLVQGLGGVGGPLARTLAAAGAEVLPSDVDGERAVAFGRELGAEPVPPEDVFDTPCDVYAPCAVGATLDQQSIPRLDCRIVAGSANNQLATAEDDARLAERDIVYVPDYVINAGGAMAFALMREGLRDHEVLMKRVEGVGETVTALLREAQATGDTPLAVARARVARVLATSSR